MVFKRCNQYNQPLPVVRTKSPKKSDVLLFPLIFARSENTCAASLMYFSECVGSRVSLHLSLSLSANISNKKSDKTVLSKDTKETFTDSMLVS